MNVRGVTKMAELKNILAKFEEVAKNPREQLDKYLKDGKKAVLCVPVYTPEEIIHSMGMVPMGAWGADTEINEAKSFFPAFICSVMQTVLECGMKGVYEGASAIVIPSLCDSLKCLGQNWKYAVKGIEFIPMTYPQNRDNDFGRKFARDGYERVIKDLERVTGLKFSNEKLMESIKLYNKHNKLMREFDELCANNPEITASQRSDVFKSAFFMLKEEHNELVEELNAALKALDKSSKKTIKVITSGILADNKNFLSIFDDNGIQIVGDDIAAESRQYRIDAKEDGDALDSLADKFARMGNCSVLFDENKNRAKYIADMVKDKEADGVVYVQMKFCDPEEFDYPLIKKELDSRNIPSVFIEIDRQMDNFDQAKTIVETFKDALA